MRHCRRRISAAPGRAIGALCIVLLSNHKGEAARGGEPHPGLRRDEAASVAQAGPYFETYEQRLEIVFKDAASARAAKLAILPLFDGREWAITTRWDDNTPSDHRMQLLMEKCGYRGTYYLNGSDHPYWGSSFGLVKDRRGLDKWLVSFEGAAIGGHSWTHPSVAYCSRNRIFEEILRVRADREASADFPICSYAFSNMVYKNGFEPEESMRDIAEALFRSGYYHITRGVAKRDMGLTIPAVWLLPWDGASVDRALGRLLDDEEKRKIDPNITFCMHAPAYKTDEAWRKLEALLTKYRGNPDWWYCNQNEYAAYRQQFLSTSVESVRDGRRLSVTLTRPCLTDLNNAVPITFEVAGVKGEAVRSVTSPAAEVEDAARGGVKRFHLHHDGARQLPAKIDWIRNDRNLAGPTLSGGDFPAVRGLLHHRDGSLRLAVENGGAVPMRGVRVTYRAPLAWENGRTVRRAGDISPGGAYRDALALRRASADYKYVAGRGFYVAQVDFVLGAAAGRLHFSCHVEGPESDPSYPRDGFLTTGPIPEGEDSAGMALSLSRGDVRNVRLKNGRKLPWRPSASKRGSRFDVEFIPVTSRFPKGGDYLLISVLLSDEERRVELRVMKRGVDAVFLNGDVLGDAAPVLRKGENYLVIVASARRLRHRGGVFLRVLKPGTNERITGVRFVSPERAR